MHPRQQPWGEPGVPLQSSCWEHKVEEPRTPNLSHRGGTPNAAALGRGGNGPMWKWLGFSPCGFGLPSGSEMFSNLS